MGRFKIPDQHIAWKQPGQIANLRPIGIGHHGPLQRNSAVGNRAQEDILPH